MTELDTATDIPRASRISAAGAVNGELRDRVQKLRLGTGGPGGGVKGARSGGAAWLPWLLCLVLALTWGGVALRTYKNTAKEADSAVIAVGPAGSSSSSATGGSNSPTESGTVQLVVKGYMTPARQITVSPIDVGGKVIKLNVVEGMLYKEGEVLAELDPASYNAAVAESRASLAGAEQRLAAAVSRRDEQDPKSVRKVEFDELEANLSEARIKELQLKRDYDRFKNAGGDAVAGREMQQAEGEFKAASARTRNLEARLQQLRDGPRPEKMRALEADVKAAQADIDAAKARLTQAEWRLGNCTIKAPITGIALTKKAELGNLVNPMAFSGGGGICDMADMSEPEVDLKIAERDIAKLKVGQRCKIVPDAFQERTYQGTIDRIMPIANRADNTINIRVKAKLLPGEVPGTYLKPDMGAVVTFLADEKK